MEGAGRKERLHKIRMEKITMLVCEEHGHAMGNGEMHRNIGNLMSVIPKKFVSRALSGDRTELESS